MRERAKPPPSKNLRTYSAKKLVRLNGLIIGQSRGEKCARCGKLRSKLYEVPCPLWIRDASCLHTPVCMDCMTLEEKNLRARKRQLTMYPRRSTRPRHRSSGMALQP